MHDRIPEKLTKTKRMQEGFELLLAYPTVGNFLAYQFITDVNYSEMTNYSESEFVIAGPGALSGIKKCFSNTAGLNPSEVVKFMTDRQEIEFSRLGLSFRTLFGRRLQYIDCQNIFCEIDKYTRVSHPELQGIAGRRRIKHRFVPMMGSYELWLPPKWSLAAQGNEVVLGDKSGI